MEETFEDIIYEQNKEEIVESTLEVEQDAVEENDPGRARFTNEFSVCKMLYRQQQVGNTIDMTTVISSNSYDEFVDNVYELVQPFVKREVEFDEQNQPFWAEHEFPTKEDLPRYVVFKDKVRKRIYRLGEISENMLNRWQKRDITLQLYIYSNNIDSRAAWDLFRQVLLGEDTNEDGTKNVITPQRLEEHRLQSIEKRLQKIHRSHLRPNTDDAYTLWAQSIMKQSVKKHRNLCLSGPPKKLLDHFTFLRNSSVRTRKSIWGPARRGHTADGYGFEEEVQALRQTVIQIKDLVEMLDRRVELLEEKCHGFRQTREGVPVKRGRYDSDGSENEDEDQDGSEMGEQTEEPAIDVASMVQVDLEQSGGGSGFPDPLFPVDCVKEENEEVESDG
ncbi:AAEL001001-PA [Aedes aegypti]|uniref:AAEL001001-PA n=2 Tax=Aedes aegypti TaxID=7159 RepID=A0A1S4EXH7_AEDAE|nr:uncharacterized protein LOC5567825 [Aedes aegypti]EAT47926.1 AAEL001001-PA [Aedes aegypti]